MRTVTLQSVLEGACEVAGLQWGDLAETEKEDVLRKVMRRTKKGWVFERWPELCPTELRHYRLEYNPATAYAAPTLTSAAEVFYTPAQKYYQALIPTTGQPPSLLVSGTYVVNSPYWAESTTDLAGNDWATATVYTLGVDIVRNPTDGRFYMCTVTHTSGGSFDSTKFGLLQPFAAYIDLDQAGQTPIGEVIQLSQNDPDVFVGNPGIIRHRLSMRGIVPLTCAPVGVYVMFRLRPPVFTVLEWDPTQNYKVGDIFFSDAAGDCFKALANITGAANPARPENDPTNWAIVQFPLVLSNFVMGAAGSDLLRSDGQNDKADKERGIAYGELSEDRMTQVEAQEPPDQVQVRTYGSR